MSFLMNRIERYLGRVIVSHTLLVLLVLLVILGFSEFMIQLGKLNDQYTLVKGTFYTLLKLPGYAYDLFPIALLIGTLMGLGGLANHSELTILRMTGWSVGRIFIGVLKSVLLLWLAMAVEGEMVAPSSEAYAKKMRDEALHRTFSLSDATGFWIKDLELSQDGYNPQNEKRYIHVEQFINDRLLANITLYRLNGGGGISVIRAKKAVFQNGQWILEQVVEQQIGLETAVEPFRRQPMKLLAFQQSEQPSLPVRLPLSPDLLQSLNVQAHYMSIWELYDYIGFLHQNGLDAAPYELAFWRKVANPLVVIGMLALVFPLIFGSMRQVSMGQRIFVGILVGMGFSLLNQIFGNLSVVYHWPLIVGAFLPSLVLVMVAFVLMRRVR